MFSLINVGKKAGSGIPTIKKAFEDNDFLEPVFYDEYNPNRTFLKLSFFKIRKVDTEDNIQIDTKIDYATLTNQEYEIVKFLSNKNEITRGQVEDLLDIKKEELMKY